MRTTVAIDDDVLAAARALAARQRRSLGEVLSDLARRGLTPPVSTPDTRNGLPTLPQSVDAGPVTTEIVNRLRNELP